MKKIIVSICIIMQSALLMGQVTNVPYNSRVNTQNLHRFSLLSVEVRPECTILRSKVTPLKDNTYIYSSKKDFIEDAETGQKYYIVGSDCGFIPDRYIMRDTNPKVYVDIFPALPPNVKVINIYEDNRGYYIKNLKLNRCEGVKSIGSSDFAIKGVQLGSPIREFVDKMRSNGYSLGSNLEESIRNDLVIEMRGGQIFDRATKLYIWYTKTSHLVYKVDVEFIIERDFDNLKNTWIMTDALYYFAKQQLTMKYGHNFRSNEFRNFYINSSYSDILDTFQMGTSYSQCGFMVPPVGTIILRMDLVSDVYWTLRVIMTYIHHDNEKLNKQEMLTQYQNEI